MLSAVYRRNKVNQQPITLTRGASNSVSVILTDTEGKPYVLEANETLRFGIKMRPESKYTQVIKVVDSSALNEDHYIFNLAPDDTADLRLGNLWYDVVLQSGDDFLPVVDISPVTVLAIVAGPSEEGDG